MSSTIVQTRLALQSVAEHVLCAARHAATGRIGLVPTPSGIATPAFPTDSGLRTLATDGLELVVTDDRGTRRAPLTTVGAAAELAEITPGAPTDVFTPTTALEPDAPLDLDPDAVAQLASWWVLVATAFERFAAEHPDDQVAAAQLWPEHFDVGGQVGEVNYGGSPGDAGDPLPYLYIGPWSPPPVDDFWNRLFGRAIPATDIAAVDAAVDAFRQARQRLDATPE